MLCLKEFFEYCKCGRGLSPDTLQGYRQSLELFAQFMAYNSIDAVENVDTKTITKFMQSEYQKGKSPATINQRLVGISQYFDYLIRFAPSCSQMKNPVVFVKRMRTPSRLPMCISESVLHKFLNNFANDSFKRARSKTMIMMMWQCGLRRSEIMDLRIDMIDFESHTMRVIGKGNKERVVPFGVSLEQEIVNLMRYRKIMGFCKSPFLFVNVNGEQMKRDDIYYLVHTHLLSIVPVQLAHPHALRHSFATTLLNHGVDIVSISRLMGHNSVQTTMRYLSLSQDFINKQIEGVF